MFNSIVKLDLLIWDSMETYSQQRKPLVDNRGTAGLKINQLYGSIGQKNSIN